MSTTMFRTMNRVTQAPQVRTMVMRSLPRAGGGHDDDHPHLVFDTPTKGPFTKTQAGVVVGGGVFLAIAIVIGAVSHQQIKHGFWKK